MKLLLIFITLIAFGNCSERKESECGELVQCVCEYFENSIWIRSLHVQYHLNVKQIPYNPKPGFHTPDQLCGALLYYLKLHT